MAHQVYTACILRGNLEGQAPSWPGLTTAVASQWANWAIPASRRRH